jgi:hypothetical protein
MAVDAPDSVVIPVLELLDDLDSPPPLGQRSIS